MADEAQIQVEGLREFVRQLKQLNEDLPKELRQINLAAAGDIAGVARSLVPHRSGRLQSSIRPLATQRGGQVAAGTGAVPYAGPIHFGWWKRHIQPQPFLYDALDSRREAVFESYVEKIGQLISKVENTGNT